MRPTKHYAPNSIYEDRAGTHYTITYKPRIKAYHMVRLQPNGERICNSGVVFSRWLRGLRLIGKGALS